MYIESYIKSLGNKIIRKYGSCNPIELINERKNLTLNFVPLTKSVNGLYKYISKKRQMIIINENLNGLDLQFALFHEFSHYSLEHKGEILLARSTTSYRKEEYEADLLAVYLFIRHNNITANDVNSMVLPKRVKELAGKFI